MIKLILHKSQTIKIIKC